MKNSPVSKFAHGYTSHFRKAVSQYYDVDKAIAMLDTPVEPKWQRWRCMLCGWPIDVTGPGSDRVGACCCGGCGQTTMRPIEEWG